MKWKESDFNNNLSSVKAVLIYGPDAGQADELVDKAIEKLGVDENGLFTLSANELKERCDALFAEACCPSFFGGRRLVFIANAGDSDAPLIRELCQHPSLDAFVVVTAGELRAGGGLRSLFEDANNMGTVACYLDNEMSLGKIIQDTLFKQGIKKIDPDAMQYMFAHLGSDRGITRSFLNKLSIYVDDTKHVNLDAVEKCLPDTGAASMDDFLYSLTAGHIAATMIALDRLFFDNAEPNQLVRMLDIHFKKLLNAVVAGQMPKVFWKSAEKFNIAVKIWAESDIISVLSRLNELELQLRTTGMPSEILIRDFALKLSVRAAKLAIKNRGK